MKKNYKFSLGILLIVTLFSFRTRVDAFSDESKLSHLEQKAVSSNQPGKEYLLDLTSIKGCNKSKVKYLGAVITQKGKSYKILTSFFVHKTGSDMCHGVSSIKIFDGLGQYLGQYSVGMPQDLPDTLIGKKLFFTTVNEDCTSRKSVSIDLSNGLPRNVFVACSLSGGDVYSFR